MTSNYFISLMQDQTGTAFAVTQSIYTFNKPFTVPLISYWRYSTFVFATGIARQEPLQYGNYMLDLPININ
jgi:hypothetical protein